MALSAVAFSLMALCVKCVTETISAFEIVFFRSFFGMFLVLPLIHRQKIPLWGKERFKLTVRGVSGCFALLLHFYTISKLELGLAIMLNYTAPIFAVIIAVFFLKEKPSVSIWSLILLSFLGVAFLNSGSGMTWRTEVWLALLSSVFAAVAYVAIRTIKHRESPLTVIFYFTFISTVGSLFFLRGWKWPNLVEWFFVAGVVVFSFYGQLWMTTSLRRAPSYLVAPLQYLHPVLSFGYGWLLWGTPVTLKTGTGVFLIVLSGSLIPYFATKVKIEKRLPSLPSETSL